MDLIQTTYAFSDAWSYIVELQWRTYKFQPRCTTTSIYNSKTWPLQTSRVWRWMIWWYWSSCSAWTYMSTTYKKHKLVTSMHDWYDVPPTVTRIPWIWTCTSSTSATSVIWRRTATVSCVRNVTKTSKTIWTDGHRLVGVGSQEYRTAYSSPGQRQRENDRTSAPSSRWIL
jgi:hypothetical protein